MRTPRVVALILAILLVSQTCGLVGAVDAIPRPENNAVLVQWDPPKP